MWPRGRLRDTAQQETPLACLSLSVSAEPSRTAKKMFQKNELIHKFPILYTIICSFYKNNKICGHYFRIFGRFGEVGEGDRETERETERVRDVGPWQTSDADVDGRDALSAIERV